MQNRHADLNVIDYEGLTSCHPEYVNDFPHNGGRIVVRSQGYDTTIVGGQVVIEKGEFSGISKWPATLSLTLHRWPTSVIHSHPRFASYKMMSSTSNRW